MIIQWTVVVEVIVDACISAVLQTHYRHLEAIALEYDSVEEVSDLTNPDKDMISKRAGALLDQFKELVYPPGYDPDSSGKKRKVWVLWVGGV